MNRLIITLFSFLFFSSTVLAQTGGTTWRIDRSTGEPFRPQYNVDGAWREILAGTGRINLSSPMIGSALVDYYQHSISIPNDNFVNIAGTRTYGFAVKHTIDGANWAGERDTLTGWVDIANAGDPTNPAPFATAVFGVARGLVPANSGIHTGLFAGNFNAILDAGATGYGSLTGVEADVTALAGSTMEGKAGLIIAQGPNDAVQGSIRDGAINVFAAPGATAGWKNIILIDSFTGVNPLGANGAIIRTAGAMTFQDGFDLSSATITGWFIKSPQNKFTVTANGAVGATSYVSSSNYRLFDSTAAANEKWSSIEVGAGGTLHFAMLDDALAATDWMNVSRTGASPLLINLLGPVNANAGTVTTSNPFIFSQTWNAGAVDFSGFEVNVTNTASAAESYPFRVKVGGSDIFSVKKDGTVTATGVDVSTGVTANSGIITTSTPSSITQTWNNAGVVFYGFKIDITDTASSLVSRPLSVTVGGADVFYVLKNGEIDASFLKLTAWLQTPTIYGGNNVGSSLSLVSTTGAGTADAINFKTGSQVTRWTVNTSGHLLAGADNTYDIGASGATRPRNVFVAGNITIGDATALIKSSVAMNNGAGAGAGTITNAPAAGNPTKWIPINDNGTTRYIPAW